jgi:HTH-type transcriptional regulator / antitoxin HigA
MLSTIILMPTQFKRYIMQIRPIKNEADYQLALKQMEKVFDAKGGTPEGDLADILALMIDDYEQRNYPIGSPDPIEAIKVRMEEMNLKQADMVNIIGTKSRVSEVLNRKRKLTLEMVRNLKKHLNIPSDVLTTDYALAR